MIRRPPRSTRTDTLFPYTTLFRSASELLFNLQSDSTGRGAQVPLRHAEIRPGDGLVDVSDVVNKQGSRPPLWGFYCKRGAGNEQMIPCRKHRSSSHGFEGYPGHVVTGNRKRSVILVSIKKND